MRRLRPRQPDEIFGMAREIWLARATHPQVLAAGQDGGLVSALLAWGLQTDRIDWALTSRRSPTRPWDAEPFLATTAAEALQAAGSRYSYSANSLAMREASRRGLKRLALVGTGCQARMNGTLPARRVNKCHPWCRTTRRVAGDRMLSVSPQGVRQAGHCDLWRRISSG
jgi:coenzyme F420 hydrogenase subunit beta